MKAAIGIPKELIFWVVATLMIVFVVLLVLKGSVILNIFKGLPALIGSLPFS